MGGAPLHVLTLSRNLAARGHQVEILSMGSGPMVGRYRQAGLEVTVVPGLGQRVRHHPRVFIHAARFVHTAMEAIRPELIHVHGPRAGFFIELSLREKRGVPLVATAHGSFTQFALGHEEEFSRSRGWLRQFEYRGVDWMTGRLADRFVAVSEATSRGLIERAGVPPRKVMVIHNGIEERQVGEARRRELRRQFGCRPGTKLVAFVGRLAFHKGVGFFVDAAEAVIRRLPNTRFVMVGEGPMEAELNRRAKKPPLTGGLSIAGQRDDAVAIIAAADLFVLPSLSEGLPLTLLEAAMCGRAMVATDVGGVSEVVREGETGLLVPPRDAVALALAMERLLENEAIRVGMGAAARLLWRQEFTAEKMVDRMERLYSDLADSQSGQPAWQPTTLHKV